MINKFINRLAKIGIAADFAANYPWIYITHINGIRITEKYAANHGFTAFTLHYKYGFKCPNRRELFKLIRKYIVRVFRASYHEQTASYSWEEYEYIVVAATIDDVVPDVMKLKPHTKKKLWKATEINTTKRSCLQT